MSPKGIDVLRSACFYLFEMYGGPFSMQRDPGAAIEIMFDLLAVTCPFCGWANCRRNH